MLAQKSPEKITEYSVRSDGEPSVVATGFYYRDDGSTQRMDGLRTELSARLSSWGHGDVRNSVALQGTSQSSKTPARLFYLTSNK